MAPPPNPPGPQPGDPIVFSRFDGLKNTEKAERLGPRDLVRARNVDISDTGQLSRRRGRTLLLAGEAHSLFTTQQGAVLGVVNGVLGVIQPGGDFTAIAAAIGASPYAGTGQLSYVQVGDTVYYTSPATSGKVDTTTMTRTDWGLPQDLWLSPVVNPTVNLPAIRGKLLGKPPNGSALAYYNGRIYIAVGPNVWQTELYLYDYVDKTRGFLPFSGDVTLLAAVGDGLYVSDDDGVWFLSHAKDMRPEQVYNAMKRVPVMDSPAIPGSLVYIPAELGNPPQVPLDNAQPTQVAIAFMTQAGWCVGQNSGVCSNMTETTYWFPGAQSAAAMFRRQDGNNQYVASLRHGGDPANNAAIGDYLDATIIRGSAGGPVAPPPYQPKTYFGVLTQGVSLAAALAVGSSGPARLAAQAMQFVETLVGRTTRRLNVAQPLTVSGSAQAGITGSGLLSAQGSAVHETLTPQITRVVSSAQAASVHETLRAGVTRKAVLTDAAGVYDTPSFHYAHRVAVSLTTASTATRNAVTAGTQAIATSTTSTLIAFFAVKRKRSLAVTTNSSVTVGRQVIRRVTAGITTHAGVVV